MSKALSKVYAERQAIVALRTEVQQLKLKYAKFKTETENIRSVFQKLIKDLKFKCDQMMYYVCLRCVTSKRYRFFVFYSPYTVK